MSRTKMAKFLKKLRVEEDETLKNMATRLNVSTSLLSSIENGSRSLSDKVATRLYESYSLTNEQKNELADAIADTSNKVEISLNDMRQERKETALKFAAAINDLDDAQLDKIKKILQAKK